MNCGLCIYPLGAAFGEPQIHRPYPICHASYIGMGVYEVVPFFSPVSPGCCLMAVATGGIAAPL